MTPLVVLSFCFVTFVKGSIIGTHQSFGSFPQASSAATSGDEAYHPQHNLSFVRSRSSLLLASLIHTSLVEIPYSIALRMDDEIAGIPVMQKPASLMEVGPNGNNLAAAAASQHPVDHLQQRMVQHNSIEYASHMYGSGLAMRLATEQRLAADFNRGAMGLPQSNMYRDIVTGNDTKLDFADFLSLPEYRPDVSKANPHAVMEHQLRM